MEWGGAWRQGKGRIGMALIPLTETGEKKLKEL